MSAVLSGFLGVVGGFASGILIGFFAWRAEVIAQDSLHDEINREHERAADLQLAIEEIFNEKKSMAEDMEARLQAVVNENSVVLAAIDDIKKILEDVS